MIAGRDAPAEPEQAPRPYEPMALREVRTRLVTRDQLERGYETVDAEGRPQRHDYRVVAYLVEVSARMPSPESSRSADKPY